MLSNENKAGYFSVGFVIQHVRNTRERLRRKITAAGWFRWAQIAAGGKENRPFITKNRIATKACPEL